MYTLSHTHSNSPWHTPALLFRYGVLCCSTCHPPSPWCGSHSPHLSMHHLQWSSSLWKEKNITDNINFEDEVHRESSIFLKSKLDSVKGMTASSRSNLHRVKVRVHRVPGWGSKYILRKSSWLPQMVLAIPGHGTFIHRSPDTLGPTCSSFWNR